MKNYYQFLGIQRDASNEDIRTAYKKLVQKFHPDKNDGDKFFEDRFKEIQEAYEILSDLYEKEKYDNDYDGFFNDRPKMDSLESILCNMLPWHITISMNPPMKMKLTFYKGGIIKGEIFNWQLIPQQPIAGNWQLIGETLYVDYSYKLANPNMMGQIVNWVPSTQNYSLRVSSFSPNQISAIQFANNGYHSNYSWFFSR